MIEYPFTKFVILDGKAHIGDLIMSEGNEYQHIDLFADELLSLPASRRRELMKSMIAGWIVGDGSQRTLVIAPDQTTGSIATAIDALTDWAREHDVTLEPAELQVGDVQPQPEVDVGTTIRRLLGLHALSAAEASDLIGVSAQALSEIQRGNRMPSLPTIQRVAAFFDVPADRLLNANFEDLLRAELSNPERFQAVEARISNRRSGGRR